MFDSKLHQVLLQGRDPEVDLADLLGNPGETPVKSKREARAICGLLRFLPAACSPGSITSRLHALTALFQDAETERAFSILMNEGVPELCRICDVLHDTENERATDDLLFVLKILAMYRTEAGTERVIEAARKPLKPDAYMWSVILGQFDSDHPHVEKVLHALSDALPRGFLAVALLDCANGHAIAGAGIRHPFDSPEGKRRLQAWLTSRNADRFSYAHSATASLPFISNPERDQLLALAMDHPDTGVQMEAAWASAKLGSDAGIKVLARYCLDPNTSATACRYLSELGREDAVPGDALDADLQAKAEFANWLSHPNELGRSPDELVIVDHRELAWPPDGERKPFWLIKYRVEDATGLEEDDVDCGLVGSVTFCLFSYRLHERPPEDAYAIHCYWEMAARGLIEETDLAYSDEDCSEMIRQWSGERLREPELIHVAEISPELGHPRRMVGLAAATLNGEEGWAVLDGDRSAWYPKSDMPGGAPPCTVLKLHVGRRLLGFEDTPDRKRFLAPAPAERGPREVAAAYEKLLDQLTAGDVNLRKNLLGWGSPLGKHFDAYIEAREALDGTTKAEAATQLYEQLLAAARESSEATGDKAFDAGSPLTTCFEKYMEALVATGRTASVEAVIEALAPHWDHNLGYGKLATAAFRCGLFDVAEGYCVRLRQSMAEWHRSEAMSLLAEIWFGQGRREDAHGLLVDCLKELLADSETATGSDRALFEDWSQRHRATYLRLFPERGDATLSEHGIPPTTRH
jgi:hypothetical protein